jgi:hypothetical protein
MFTSHAAVLPEVLPHTEVTTVVVCVITIKAR